MAEEESLKQRLELKVKKRDYTGYDDDEFLGVDQGPSKRSILAKYDEEINGRQQTVRICPKWTNYITYSSAPRISDWAVPIFPPKHTETNRKSKQQQLLTRLCSPLIIQVGSFSSSFRPYINDYHLENLETNNYQDGDVGFKKPKV